MNKEDKYNLIIKKYMLENVSYDLDNSEHAKAWDMLYRFPKFALKSFLKHSKRDWLRTNNIEIGRAFKCCIDIMISKGMERQVYIALL